MRYKLKHLFIAILIVACWCKLYTIYMDDLYRYVSVCELYFTDYNIITD
jgi:hypothetical protein